MNLRAHDGPNSIAWSILKCFARRPRWTAEDIANLCCIEAPTALRHLKIMVDKGILKEAGQFDQGKPGRKPMVFEFILEFEWTKNPQSSSSTDQSELKSGDPT